MSANLRQSSRIVEKISGDLRRLVDDSGESTRFVDWKGSNAIALIPHEVLYLSRSKLLKLPTFTKGESNDEIES